MEQFEKWLHEVEFPHLNGKLGSVQWDYCGDAWRAALSWAAKQIRNDSNGYFNILKELHEEDT